jgi:hypothetical protein
MSRPALRFPECEVCRLAEKTQFDEFVLNLVNMNITDLKSHQRVHTFIQGQYITRIRSAEAAEGEIREIRDRLSKAMAENDEVCAEAKIIRNEIRAEVGVEVTASLYDDMVDAEIYKDNAIAEIRAASDKTIVKIRAHITEKFKTTRDDLLTAIADYVVENYAEVPSEEDLSESEKDTLKKKVKVVLQLYRDDRMEKNSYRDIGQKITEIIWITDPTGDPRTQKEIIKEIECIYRYGSVSDEVCIYKPIDARFVAGIRANRDEIVAAARASRDQVRANTTSMNKIIAEIRADRDKVVAEAVSYTDRVTAAAKADRDTAIAEVMVAKTKALAAAKAEIVRINAEKDKALAAANTEIAKLKADNALLAGEAANKDSARTSKESRALDEARIARAEARMANAEKDKALAAAKVAIDEIRADRDWALAEVRMVTAEKDSLIAKMKSQSVGDRTYAAAAEAEVKVRSRDAISLLWGSIRSKLL